MPPRNPDSAPKFWGCVEELVKLRPDFLSITYGAAGKDRTTALNTIKRVVTDTPILPVAHLTCMDTPKEAVEQIVDEFLAEGVRMFLALRGDQQVDVESPRSKLVESAAELTYLMRAQDKRRQRLNHRERFKTIARPLVICVAAFPGGNPELGTTPAQEIDRLLQKQDAGADFAITQLYYDPKVLDDFITLAHKRGVSIPIVAGIGPTFDHQRLLKIENNINIKPSPELFYDLQNASTDTAREDIGLKFYTDLSTKALESGAVGLHFFTFNNLGPTVKLVERLKECV
ncbi:methylenetetrahydrofolate reductase [Actinomycetota bacterium]|nr:methylenetetrahydrofolate reductase [Actinomycetota bacterium]